MIKVVPDPPQPSLETLLTEASNRLVLSISLARSMMMQEG